MRSPAFRHADPRLSASGEITPSPRREWATAAVHRPRRLGVSAPPAATSPAGTSDSHDQGCRNCAHAGQDSGTGCDRCSWDRHVRIRSALRRRHGGAGRRAASRRHSSYVCESGALRRDRESEASLRRQIYPGPAGRGRDRAAGAHHPRPGVSVTWRDGSGDRDRGSRDREVFIRYILRRRQSGTGQGSLPQRTRHVYTQRGDSGRGEAAAAVHRKVHGGVQVGEATTPRTDTDA